MTPWEQFENELADELGLERVAGSGNQWHSKLDVKGKGTRWSLKYTDQSKAISKADIAEALLVTGGVGGGGEIPIWAIRFGDMGDFILQRKEDWINFMMGEATFEIMPSKAQRRKRLAETPQLFRSDNAD